MRFSAGRPHLSSNDVSYRQLSTMLTYMVFKAEVVLFTYFTIVLCAESFVTACAGFSSPRESRQVP